MSGLSRRGLLRGAVYGAGAAVSASALSGCGSIAGSVRSTDEIEYWTLFTGPDGELMKTMTRNVEKRVPGLKVRTTVLDWGPPYYTKLAMASAGGRSPDVAIMHLTRLAGYAPGGLLDPWDMDLLAEFGLKQEDLNKTLVKRSLYQGDPYAVPLDTHPFVVFFDRDVLDKAGLLTGDGQLVPFESPKHALELMDKLRKDGGKLGPVFGHANDAAMGWRMFWTLFSQTGATFDLTGKRAEIDEDTAVEVVRFMADLTRDSRTMDVQTAIAAFANGRSPMIFSGEWDMATYKSTLKDKLGGSPIPTFYDRPAGASDSHALVLPHQDNPDPERRRRAHRFVAELVRSGLTWATAGHIPAYTPAVSSAQYAKLRPQSEYAGAAKQLVLDPPVWFAGSGSDFQTRMCQALDPALGGSSSAQSAVRTMVSQINTLLAQPNPA
ncbi:extracellular solute-binding protein [Streptomyces sp. MK37H]|uniref:extracellular solute-binding protein n=1 Tax=Streptomyces sp. MK37H TaxID=2699117 RepID=UPI001B39C2AC|nr:extracellular solute-binding protein [Streptomyces sp. MK37H]MBP8532110.1 extracellular solute-binding protein [Streptomyces sp. MK37H]